MDYYGIFHQLRLCEVITKIIKFFPEDLVAVVRSIDSAYLREDLEEIMKFHKFPYKILNGNVCLFRKDLQHVILSEKLFFGFDELWLFSGSVPEKDLSEIPAATSDGQDFSEKLPSKTLEAFHETGCTVILGDGCGLNYLTTNLAIAEKLKDLNAEFEKKSD